MDAELSALEAEIARNTSVDGSVSVLVDGLIAKVDGLIADLGTSPTAAQVSSWKAKAAELTATLRASSDTLAAKVVENTPAADPVADIP